MENNGEALFNISAPRPGPGRHANMLETAINAAKETGAIIDVDEGLLSLARANAVALDEAEADRKYYAIAQLTGPYREVLESLRMTPEKRESEANDELNKALAELGTAAIRDA